MKEVLTDVSEVVQLISEGKTLLLAGDESVLKQLPKGTWIGGTIPYFIGQNGGVFIRDQIYVTMLPDHLTSIEIKSYNSETIQDVYKDGPDNGFGLIIIPASSDTHLQFALKAPEFESFAMHPLIGWVSGVPLDQLGKVTPKVFDGRSGAAFEDRAVVLNMTLDSSEYAEINIINIFQQGAGDTITFPKDGFQIKEALINGINVNFAQYLKEKGIDTKLPLVADLNGAMINTSVQAIHENSVDLYAPVFADTDYKIAAPVENYVEAFTSMIPNESPEEIFFACNCILNYLYSGLEGKKTGHFTGPITFGEIAYQLLNQTMTYVAIKKL